MQNGLLMQGHDLDTMCKCGHKMSVLCLGAGHMPRSALIHSQRAVCSGRHVCCAEVVLFTAGLEDYAQPILDKLQQRYTCFHARLYRTATSASRSYPCIKVPPAPTWLSQCSAV